MRISQLLNEDNVFITLQAGNKEEAITKLVKSLKNQFPENKVDDALHAVLEREAIMSTGVGKGLAIPHGKCAGLEQSHVAFAILDKPLDYGSIDNQPVSMIFLLIGPDSQNSKHIKMLSRVSRLMNNAVFRDKLLQCEDKESILALFKEEEAQFIRA